MDISKEFNCIPLAKQFAQAKINGETQKSFAEKCQIDNSRVGKFLSGKALPSTNELQKLCSTLNCTPNDIIARNEA